MIRRREWIRHTVGDRMTIARTTHMQCVTGRVGGLYSLGYEACGVIHIHWIYVLAIKVYTSTLQW
jgi:hypothetical protein